MGYLLLGSIGLIVFGTLYPFRVACPATFGLALGRFDPLLHPIGRGDLAANLVLFIPLGLAAFAWADRWPRAARIAFAVGLGATLSVAVELAQTCTSRTASWTDVALNVVSTAIGIALAPAFRWGLDRLGTGKKQPDVAAALLLAMFAVWQLAPFVPTIDWQKWRNALKPLFLQPEIALTTVLGYAALWLAIARLSLAVFNPARPILLWMGLAAGQFALEMVIVGQAVRLGEVLGALFGIALASLLVLRQTAWRDPLLALLLAAYIVDRGLEPYAFAPGTGPFHWMPFAGFLGGSLFVAVQSFGQKMFMYGTLLWLASRAGMRLGKATVLMALGILGLEFAQMRLPGRVAEITDPLLVLLAALLIQWFDGKRMAKAPRAKRRPART